MTCPCHSGLAYDLCCAPYHMGKENPPTPLALMRSRYSAYALQKVDYVVETAEVLQNVSEQEKGEIARFSQETTFDGLNIIDVDGDTVLFKARLSQKGRDVSFREKSLFVWVDGRWKYKSALIYTRADHGT